jgi:hypothetical protein
LSLTAAALFSCSGTASSGIPLFNGVSFQLQADERTVELRPADREYFNSILEVSDIQIPLFRRIESPTHSIYIGLPIGTSLEEMNTLMRDHSITSSSSMSTNEAYVHHAFKHSSDSSYVIQHLHAFDNNLVLVLVITENQTIAENAFQADSIAVRFTRS